MTGADLDNALLMDVGNSRLKWAWFSNDKLIGHSYLIHGEQDIVRGLAGLAAAPDRVICSSVAGSKINARVTEAVRQQFGVPAEFVNVEDGAFGLRLAYRDADHLGVDRWLAMLGAMTQASGPFCVADAGTALTVDFVAHDGEHVGGLIAPGIQTMIHSLVDGTSGIDASATHLVATPFADDTGPAVQAGALYATSALIDRFVVEASRKARADVPLYFTGGGRAPMMQILQTPAIEVGDLVLQGLARVARRPTDVKVEEAEL